MTNRVNLVDAYDNRSVVAKLVNMEERISGAESSIEQAAEQGVADLKAIRSDVNATISDFNGLVDGKVEQVTTASSDAVTTVNTTVTSAKADISAAVSDAETAAGAAVVKVNNAVSSAETTIDTKVSEATGSISDSTVAASNSVIDAQGYAYTGKLHDGTVVTSADAIEKQCETLRSDCEAIKSSISISVTETTKLYYWE